MDQFELISHFIVKMLKLALLKNKSGDSVIG